MSGKQETSADIIAEMRGARTEFPFVYLMCEPDTPEVIDLRTKEITEPRKINIRRVTVKELADRMESALKRESGNSAALREALEPWIAFAEWLLENAGKDGLGKAIQENGPIIRQRLEELRDALAAPPRNCDVGTAEEQAERYMNFCHNYPKCTGCPCVGRILYNQCQFAWAQLPYEAKEGGNNVV